MNYTNKRGHSISSKKEKLKASPVAKFIPNAVTLTSMCFGLTAIRYSQFNEWDHGLMCILISAVFDMFDGKIARFLDQSTAFGLQIDSLSDLVCFGVAPAIVLYTASMQDIGIFGWLICLFYTVSCAIRLARFNVSHACSEEITELDRKYFVGIPAPVGAIIALFPLILYSEMGNTIIVSPLYVTISLLFSGCMMVSTVPTFSSKIFESSNINKRVLLSALIFVIICFIIEFWISLSILVAVYILGIPYGIYKYSKAVKALKYN